MAKELKVEKAQRDRSWSCYSCDKIQQKVIYFKDKASERSIGMKQEFMCPDCLWEQVATGKLVVAIPAPDGEVTDQPADEEAHRTVAVPVDINDDGSITVGDIEVRW